MALVVYNQDGTNNPAASKKAGSRISRQDSEYQQIRQKLESLMAETREKPLLGLSNQGATCYMNSLLQSLFMTPEVRSLLYSYTSENKTNTQYNIPLQLQKLFARLEHSKQSAVSTEALTRSFHWTSSESFQQQDVQEFCRVLFDAIDVSLQGSAISNLFEGQSQSYVRCLACGYESTRDDTFLDLTLPIKNEFGTGVLNSSIEMALENYIKPEVLTDGNQYFCEQCDKKCDAEKGIKLTKGPQILTVVLNRFTLDYNTFQRVKLTERVSFPMQINFNDYLHGYDGIKTKKYDKEVQRMNLYAKNAVEKNLVSEATKNEKIKEKFDQIKTDETTPATTSRVEREVKIIVGEDSITSQSEASKSDVFEAVYDKPPSTRIDYGKLVSQSDLDDNYIPPELRDNPIVQKKDQSLDDFYANLTQSLQSELTSTPISADGEYSIKHKSDKFAIVRPVTTQQPSDYTSSFQDSSQNYPTAMTEEEELAQALLQIREMEEKEEADDPEHANVDNMLTQGEFVYELYAVLVHTGGAFGGHYFAYIKNISDGLWYNFNDSHVTPLTDEQIHETYGGGSGKNTAYMLMYRKCGEVQVDLKCPDDLKEELLAETRQLIEEQIKLEEKILQMKLKVWYNGQQEQISVKRNQTFEELKKQIGETFNLPETSFRLRQYDVGMKVRTNVVTANDSDLLFNINHIQQHLPLDVEIGPDFEEYNPQTVYVRISVYQPGQEYDSGNLHLFAAQVVGIQLDQTVEDLERKVCEATGIQMERLIILLRHEQVNQLVRAEYFNMDWRKTKVIRDCSKIEHGWNLFVEDNDPKAKFDTYNWKQEFDSEADKITLFFNDPSDKASFEHYPIRVSILKSESLGNLKEVVSQKIGVPTAQFFLKNSMSDREIKEYTKSVQSMGLTMGNNIKIELGKPKNEGCYSIELVKIKLDNSKDRELFVKETLGQMLVKVCDTGAALKGEIRTLYNISDFRIRNPMNNGDLGEVIRDTDLMEDLYLHDGKEILLQIDDSETFIPSEIESKDYVNVVVREWNASDWSLGPIKEVQIPKQSKSHDLGQVLKKLYPHIENMFGCRFALMKTFARSDLMLKKWFQITTSGAGNQFVGVSSAYSLTRDGIIIFIKDNSIPVRTEPLTDEEMDKWCNGTYREHIDKKKRNFGGNHKDHDSLLSATQNRQVDWSKPVRAEKGVKITVGDSITDEPVDDTTVGEFEEGGIDFEPFF